MNTSLTVRIPEEVKKDLQKMAKDMGLTLSSLVSATLVNLRKQKKLEISTEPCKSYSDKIKNDADFRETVFIAQNSEDIDKFFNELSAK